jgi:ankyrin repeat protein
MKKVENTKTTVPRKPLPQTTEGDSYSKSEALFSALYEMALDSEPADAEEIQATLVEATRDIIKKCRSSKSQLIAKLSIVDHPVTKSLIKHLSSKKIPEELSEKKLKEHLLKHTKELIFHKKNYDNSPTNGDRTLLNHHEDIEKLKFSLSAFDFDADTVLTHGDEKGYTLLMLTCEKSKHLHLLKYLVNKLQTERPKASAMETINETIRSGTLRGRTALHLACRNGNVDGVEFLLEKGADPNAGKITPLGDAFTEEQHEVVECLLKHKSVDANQCSNGIPRLLLAAQHSNTRIIVTLIVVNNANPNIKGPNKESILQLLLMRPVDKDDRKDRNTAILFLLNSKLFELDLNTPCQDQTLIFMATRMGYPLAVQLLLEKGDNPHTLIKRGPYQGHNAISIAIFEGHLDIVKRFIEEANKAKVVKLDFETPFTTKQFNMPLRLMEIAEFRRLESYRPNYAPVIQALHSHWVATNPGQVRTHIGRLIKADRDDTLMLWEHFLLSDQGIDPITGNTPLHIASKHGKMKSLSTLIEYVQVSIDTINKKGNSSLHFACENKNEGAVEFLLDCRSNLNLYNEDQETPFDIANRRNNEDCLRLLLKKRAAMKTILPSIEEAISTQRHALAKILLENISPDKESDRIHRLLQQSATTDNIIIFTLLAEKIISFNPKGIDILGILPTIENEELFMLPLSIFEKYLEKNEIATLINTSLNSESRNTLLHEICIIGNQNFILLLTNLGGDLSRKNKFGETPLDLIEKLETKEHCSCLLKQSTSQPPQRIASRNNTVKHKPAEPKARETTESQKTIEVKERLAAKKLAAKNKQETKPKKPSTPAAITTSEKQRDSRPKASANIIIPAKVTPTKIMASPLEATFTTPTSPPEAPVKTKAPLPDPTDEGSSLSSDSLVEAEVSSPEPLDESKSSSPEPLDKSKASSPEPLNELKELKVRLSSKFCTFFCATPKDNNPYVDPLPVTYFGETDTPLSNLTKNIERLLLCLKSSESIIEDKVILEILADLYNSLNYFAVIEDISESTPMLILLKKLTVEIKTYGLVSLYNLETWKNAALMTYQNILNISRNFHFDSPDINSKPVVKLL